MSFPLLVLDKMTLFYHLLSIAKPSKAASLIKLQAVNVSEVVHPESKTRAPASSTHTTLTSLNNLKAHMTATSSAVVVSSNIKVRSKPVNNVQGFADKDETEE